MDLNRADSIADVILFLVSGPPAPQLLAAQVNFSYYYSLLIINSFGLKYALDSEPLVSNSGLLLSCAKPIPNPCLPTGHRLLLQSMLLFCYRSAQFFLGFLRHLY